MNGAARIVLRDWTLGNFPRYTTPPAQADNVTAAQSSTLAKVGDSITQLYANDEAILSVIKTRKERRKQGGLVKFKCGSIDPRKAAVEQPWNGLEQNSDDEGGDEADDDDDEGMDVDREEEEEEEEGEEGEEEASDAEMEDSQEGEENAENVDEDDDESEIEQPRLSRKQKRKRGSEKSMPLPPAKKTAFTAMTAKSDRSKIEAAMKSKKLVTGKSKDKNEPEVYDFGKFF